MTLHTTLAAVTTRGARKPAKMPPEVGTLEEVLETVRREFRSKPSSNPKSIEFFAGQAYVLAVEEYDEDRPGEIAYRRSNYFQVVSLHPGLNPDILDTADWLMQQRSFGFPSVKAIRQHILRNYGRNNPYRRPMPLGVSLGIRAGLGDDAQILCSLRSQRVALNPGVWTTAVDEGVSSIEKFPLGYLYEGLSSEISHSTLKPDLQDLFSSPALVGLCVPLPPGSPAANAQGVVSGVNALYECVTDEPSLVQVMEHANEHSLQSGQRETKEFSIRTALDLSQGSEISHTLKEYANWVRGLDDN
jgi:hypothetical protein